MESPTDEHRRSWLAVRDEVNRELDRIDTPDMRAIAAQFAQRRRRRWFAHGQGRSGLVAQMVAMRLMHVGFDVHVVGEATAPSIAAGDGLLVVSGSGESATTLRLARLATEAGATVLAVTTSRHTTLAALADTVLAVGAPNSQQFGGSLFEQTSLLLLDAVVLDLTADDPLAYQTMRSRHANLL